MFRYKERLYRADVIFVFYLSIPVPIYLGYRVTLILCIYNVCGRMVLCSFC